MPKLSDLRAPDDDAVRFGRFFYQADVAHIALLHAAGTRAGFVVNGRASFTPWSFADLTRTEETRHAE